MPGLSNITRMMKQHHMGVILWNWCCTGTSNVLILSLISLSICCRQKGGHEKTVHSKSYTIEEMKEAASEYGMSSSQVDSAVEVGIFVPPPPDCSREIPLEPPQDFSWFNPQEDLSLRPEAATKALLSSLYRVFADPNIPQDEVGDYDNLPLNMVLDSIIGGVWAPQCAGISRTAARVIGAYSADLHAMVVETEYLDHTLNIISFEEEGHRYAVVADFQNGFLFPVKPVSGSFFSRKEIECMSAEDGSFHWLPDHMQHRKRNLLFSLLPCNFLPDPKERYHRAPEGSPYAFERLSFSFHKHIWFDLGMADVDSLRNELLVHLRNTGP